MRFLPVTASVMIAISSPALATKYNKGPPPERTACALKMGLAYNHYEQHYIVPPDKLAAWKQCVGDR